MWHMYLKHKRKLVFDGGFGASSTSQGFTVAIEWQLARQGKPLLDWFSRDEYRRYLKEI